MVTAFSHIAKTLFLRLKPLNTADILSQTILIRIMGHKGNKKILQSKKIPKMHFQIAKDFRWYFYLEVADILLITGIEFI
jgi:hypothetical protein